MQKAKFRVCSGRDLNHAVGSVASRHNLISCSKSSCKVGGNEVWRCQICESKQRKGREGLRRWRVVRQFLRKQTRVRLILVRRGVNEAEKRKE
jgi:hypothetical protein